MRSVKDMVLCRRLWAVSVICLLLLTFGQVQPAFAAESEADLQSFLQEIQSASDQVRSFSAKFDQERKLALFAEPVVFHGSLTVARPDRLRWEFTSPVPSVLIFNGERGMRCNEDAPPVHFDLGGDPIMHRVAEQLWLWLGGDYSRLTSMYLMEKSGPSSLTITPRDQAVSQYVGAITITFNKTSKQPEKVEIAEPGGDTTVISFNSYVLNSNTPDVLFNLCGTE